MGKLDGWPCFGVLEILFLYVTDWVSFGFTFAWGGFSYPTTFLLKK